MSHEVDGKRVAFLVAENGVESVEVTVPWAAVRNAGGRPFLVSTGLGPIQGTNLGAPTGETFKVDYLTAQLAARDCSALVLPGGLANAQLLRESSDAVRLVSELVGAGGRCCRGALEQRGRAVQPGPRLDVDHRQEFRRLAGILRSPSDGLYLRTSPPRATSGVARPRCRGCTRDGATCRRGPCPGSRRRACSRQAARCRP